MKLLAYPELIPNFKKAALNYYCSMTVIVGLPVISLSAGLLQVEIRLLRKTHQVADPDKIGVPDQGISSSLQTESRTRFKYLC
jgi:hypothetical protein